MAYKLMKRSELIRKLDVPAIPGIGGKENPSVIVSTGDKEFKIKSVYWADKYRIALEVVELEGDWSNR